MQGCANHRWPSDRARLRCPPTYGASHRRVFSAAVVPFGSANALMEGMNDDARELRTRLLLKVSDAGAMLGVGRSTVYELIARGELEAVHIGRCCRIPTAAVEQYVRRLRDSATQLSRH